MQKLLEAGKAEDSFMATTAGATPVQSETAKGNFVNYANLEEMEEKLKAQKFEEIENEVKTFVDYKNVMQEMQNAFGASGGIGENVPSVLE